MAAAAAMATALLQAALQPCYLEGTPAQGCSSCDICHYVRAAREAWLALQRAVHVVKAAVSRGPQAAKAHAIARTYAHALASEYIMRIWKPLTKRWLV
eukprot:350208-Chlamydomonas_euryale.AAC.14